MEMKRLAIFASGSGTNAEAIIKHFDKSTSLEVALVLSNKPDAYVLKRAENHGIPFSTFERTEFYNSHEVLDLLRRESIDYIILAGFLWLIPLDLTNAYTDRIINIHPALLPKYGGKGMYGNKVHESVILNGELESGITIHLVDEKYDNGRVLCQESVPISPNDTPNSLAKKIHVLEHKFYPKTIEEYVLKNHN